MGEPITVTATVGDGSGSPVPDGSPVSFVVTGADGAEGSGIVAGPPVVAMAARPAGDGYWLVGTDGTVLAFGAAHVLGDAAADGLHDVVGIASTNNGEGYWLATADGNVLAFGDATGASDYSTTLGTDRVVGITRTPGNGYRLATQSGRILPETPDASVGDLPSSRIAPPHPIVGLANTPSGNGYWLFDAQARVYPFGDAAFHGDMANAHINRPVVSLVPYGDGYLLVGNDGGIFDFSTRPFAGSLGSTPPAVPVTGVVATQTNGGYWMVDGSGRVYPFGDAKGFGSVYTVTTQGGQATFSFTSLFPGSTKIQAVPGYVPTYQTGPSITQEWQPGSATQITLAASDPLPRTNTTETIVATVSDAFDNPAPDGTQVTFSTVGTGAESPALATVATLAGEASFSFTSPRPGTTTMTATTGTITGSTLVVWQPSGYWMISSAGDVYGFGDAQQLGGQPTTAVHIQPTPSGRGYWILNSRGDVFPKGDAANLGGANLVAGENAVSLSATPDGSGYWIFTDKGRVIPRGTAPVEGDMSAVKLNGPVLNSVATPSGRGYWMVASDGGIFSFGDAKFFGSMGGKPLNKPVISMAPDPDGVGYWLVASDGGIFAFEAPFFGSTGNLHLNKPVSGMVTGPAGYLMVAEDGGIFAFGDVQFHGSLGANPPQTPIIAVALVP